MMNAAPKPWTARVRDERCSASRASEHAERPGAEDHQADERGPTCGRAGRRCCRRSAGSWRTRSCRRRRSTAAGSTVAPSSRTSVGSATLTIVPSMPTTAAPGTATPRTRQRRGSAARCEILGSGLLDHGGRHPRAPFPATTPGCGQRPRLPPTSVVRGARRSRGGPRAPAVWPAPPDSSRRVLRSNRPAARARSNYRARLDTPPGGGGAGRRARGSAAHRPAPRPPGAAG